MRLGEAVAYAAIAVSLTAVGSPAFAADEPPAPLPPLPSLADARPRLPPASPSAPVPWSHHIEVGTGVALTEMISSVDGAHNPTGVRFKPGAGFHVDLSWQVFRFLRFTGYLVEHDNPLQLPPGSLGLPGTLTGPKVHAYSFGVRFSPTLPLGSRVRLWLTAGAGWGRLEYGRFTLSDGNPMNDARSVRERAASIVEVPLGVGGSVVIIPRWLSLDVEVTGSLVPSQIGNALETGQTIRAGVMANVGPMPRLDASFVQTLGLALHL